MPSSELCEEVQKLDKEAVEGLCEQKLDGEGEGLCEVKGKELDEKEWKHGDFSLALPH